MRTMIVKWGNSQGIRIPKTLLQTVNISETDTVDMEVVNEQIIIKKAAVKKHKTTKERLCEFYGDNLKQKPIYQKEIDWGKPVGDETW